MAEQEYTPTEARLRDRVKGSLGEYAHEFGIDGEAAMDEWIDQALAERDNRVRADERAKGLAYAAGLIEDQASGYSKTDPSPRLAAGLEIAAFLRREAGPIPERAKRPDRRQIARALFEADGRRNYDGSPTPWHILDLDEQAHYRKLADAVLSSLALEPEAREEPSAVAKADADTLARVMAKVYEPDLDWDNPTDFDLLDRETLTDSARRILERMKWSGLTFWHLDDLVLDEFDPAPRPAPEAREEPKHGLIEDYTAVQAPDWTKVSGKLDARDITDAELVAAARRMFIYDTATAGDSEGAWDTMDEETILRKMYLTRARAVLEAARDVQS